MIRNLKAAMFLGVACVMAGGATTAMAKGSGPSTAAHKLPGGASSLNETYQDWQVMCQQSPVGARCAAVQQEFSNQTHQRILNVQLSPAADGHTAGVVMAPLGVALAKGVVLQADGKIVGAPMSFTACVSDGCIAPATFSASQLNMLQGAKRVEVKLSSLTGQNLTLPLSAKGLSDAVARVNALMH